MPSIFLSHSHQDKAFVRRLATDLTKYGVRVWVDEAEMMVGDSLLQKLRSGIDGTEYLGVIVSRSSADSEWVKREVDIAMSQEIAGRRVKVLPLLLDDSPLPGFLEGKLYADFRGPLKYSTAFELLLRRLGVKRQLE